MSLVIDTLRASTVSEEMSEAEIEIIAALFDVQNYKRDEIISQPGDHNIDSLFVLAHGDIDVKIQGNDEKATQLHVLKPGDLAGIITFVGVPAALHTVTLISVDSTTVLRLERSRFETLINSHPMIVYKFMRGVVRNVHGIARRMNLQSSELSNYIYRTEGRY